MCYTPTYATTDVAAQTWADPTLARPEVGEEISMSKIKVLLLRGVNVAGANRLPMPEFRQLLLELGLAQIHTHIQSGNVVFLENGVKEVEAKIAAGMKDRFGFAPAMFLMDLADYDAILAANPYQKQAAADGSKVFIYFLRTPASVAELQQVSSFAKDGEALVQAGSAMYLYAPNGVGRSLLAGKLETGIKADKTARNLRLLPPLPVP
jgi:uncharacterized protein (DUF1697 family)